MGVTLIAQILHGQSDVGLVAACALQGGVVLLHDFQHVGACHGFGCLTIFGLTEADGYYLSDVFLLHVGLVHFLYAAHFFIVEPIGCFQLSQFVYHLGIQLLVVNIARVVDELSFGYGQTDVSATARGISQRMGIVGRGYERGVAQTVVLAAAEDRSSVDFVLLQSLFQGSML